MESIVDRIRLLCQKNKTSITKIEIELGYANGTIGKWAHPNRKPPLEKVIAISSLLNCSTSYLLTGEEQKETPPAQSGELSEIQKEALAVLQRMDDDTLRKFIQIAKTMIGE